VDKEFIWDSIALGAQLGNGAGEIDRVPKDHSGNREINTGSAVALVFEGAVANFAVSMKKQGPGERVARLALVEPRVRAPARPGR